MITAGKNAVIKKGALYGGKGITRGLRVPPYHVGKMVVVSKIEDNAGGPEAYIQDMQSWIPTRFLSEIPQFSPQKTKIGSHGLSYTRLYRIYHAMKQRCYNQKSSGYRFYGARGITICKEWLDDFEVFYHWAVAAGYSDELEIDRINPDSGYCPQNCRWITRSDNVARANHRKKQKDMHKQEDTI